MGTTHPDGTDVPKLTCDGQLRREVPKMEITAIGVDLAKHVFQVHAVDAQGHTVLRKRLGRSQMVPFFTRLSPCLVGMEACGSAHYWARRLVEMGHTVKLMAPHFVKPYVKTNKNDMNDAEAICEAVQRPNMRFVAIKTVEQQSILHLHVSRQLLVKMRTQVSNHLRGLLGEYGVILLTQFRSISLNKIHIKSRKENGIDIKQRNVNHRSINVLIAINKW
jgi:transposase